MSIRETFSNTISLSVTNDMINVLCDRFKQCLGTFTILLVEGSSETGIFRHFSDYVFQIPNFENTKSMRVIFFFSKYSKFNLDFKNAAKNSEKFFCFWDNGIWIGIVKLSLLTRGYISSVAKVLTSSAKIWHVNKRDFFEHNFHASNYWIW